MRRPHGCFRHYLHDLKDYDGMNAMFRRSDIERTAKKNPLYREPNHIRTASELGLGTWDLDTIDRRRIAIKGA